MKNILSIACVAVALLVVSTTTGCGDSDKPEIVGGVSDDFLAEIDAGRSNFDGDMKSGEKK